MNGFCIKHFSNTLFLLKVECAVWATSSGDITDCDSKPTLVYPTACELLRWPCRDTLLGKGLMMRVRDQDQDWTSFRGRGQEFGTEEGKLKEEYSTSSSVTLVLFGLLHLSLFFTET